MRIQLSHLVCSSLLMSSCLIGACAQGVDSSGDTSDHGGSSTGGAPTPTGGGSGGAGMPAAGTGGAGVGAGGTGAGGTPTGGGTGGGAAVNGGSAGASSGTGGISTSGGGPAGGAGGSGGKSGAGGTAAGGTAAGGTAAGGTAAGGTAAGGTAAGGGGATGTGGAPATTASGVEKLSVPLTAVGQGQRWNVDNNTASGSPYDLSGATVTFRVYAPNAIGGDLNIFFSSGTGTASGPALQVGLSTITAGYTNIPVAVPAAVAGGFDPTAVTIIRLEVEAAAAFGSTFQAGATIVYVDSIVSSNGVVNEPFDAAPTGATAFASSGARPLTGSTNTWMATAP